MRIIEYLGCRGVIHISSLHMDSMMPGAVRRLWIDLVPAPSNAGNAGAEMLDLGKVGAANHPYTDCESGHDLAAGDHNLTMHELIVASS